MTLWIERHATLPMFGASLRMPVWNSSLLGREAILNFTADHPLGFDLIWLSVLCLFLFLAFTPTRALPRSPPSRSRPFRVDVFLLLAFLIPFLLWVPTGFTLWNLQISQLPLLSGSIPPLLTWFLGLSFFWAGILFLYYYPKRASLTPLQIRGAYLFFALITPFLSVDRLLLSLAWAAFLPSINQHLLSTVKIPHDN